MVKWSAWKSVLAGAVIGFVEAAGPEAARRRIRRPLAVVRVDHGHAETPLEDVGVWFLDPLPDPRPKAGDRRLAGPRGALRLARVHPVRLLRALWPSGS